MFGDAQLDMQSLLNFDTQGRAVLLVLALTFYFVVAPFPLGRWVPFGAPFLPPFGTPLGLAWPPLGLASPPLCLPWGWGQRWYKYVLRALVTV